MSGREGRPGKAHGVRAVPPDLVSKGARSETGHTRGAGTRLVWTQWAQQQGHECYLFMELVKAGSPVNRTETPPGCQEVDGYSCEVDGYSCEVDAYSCEVDGYSCEVDVYSCEVDVYSCEVDAYSCEVDV